MIIKTAPYSQVLIRMKRVAEVEYRLLLTVNNGSDLINPDLLEVFSYKSDNPWFRTEEFRRLFIYYRTVGYPILNKRRAHELKVQAMKRRREREKARPKRPYHRRKPLETKANETV